MYYEYNIKMMILVREMYSISKIYTQFSFFGTMIIMITNSFSRIICKLLSYSSQQDLKYY